MPDLAAAATPVLAAAARARGLRGRVLVVKLGGSAMEDPAATAGTLDAVAALQTLGVRLVLVHGGGKPIDRAMQAEGLEPRKVLGRRYTDEKTLAVVVRVLRAINADLAVRLREHGGSGYSLQKGDDDEVLYGDRLTLPGTDGRPVDLGRVGQVTRVDADELLGLTADGYVPIVPSLAVSDEDGGWLNVNADTAAGAVAGAVAAEACYFLTDTPGVLRDVRDPGSLLPRVTEADCRMLIADGVIAGGMVPKVEACFDALAAGADRAVILDGRNPFALLAEFATGTAAGTVVVR